MRKDNSILAIHILIKPTKKALSFLLYILIWASLVGCFFTGKNHEADHSQGLLGGSDHASQLLNAFAAFCPTNGRWTTNSLAEVEKIQAILEAKRDDSDCMSMARAINRHIRSLEGALEKIRKTQGQESSTEGLRRQQMEIMFMMGDSWRGGDEALEELEEMFRANRLALSSSVGSLEYDKKRADQEYLASVIVNSSSAFFQHAAQSPKCLMSSPGILSSAIAILGNLGAALTTGGASLAFAGSVSILGDTLEYFRQLEIDEEIQRLNQGKFKIAYQCVLESLSNQWCEAKEMYELLDLKTKNPVVQENKQSNGIKILDQDLNLLMSWLQGVRVATAPESLAIAEGKADFIELSNALQIWRVKAFGRVGDTKRKLPKKIVDTEFNKERQYNLLIDLVKNLQPNYNPTGAWNPNLDPNPFEMFHSNQVPWLLSGIPIGDVPEVEGSDGNKALLKFAPSASVFLSYEKLRKHYPLDLDTIKDSVKSLYDLVVQIHNEQRNEILHVDPESLLDDATNKYYVSGLKYVKNLSPIDAIDNILYYFRQNDIAFDLKKPLCDDVAKIRQSQKENPNIETILCLIRHEMVRVDRSYNQSLREIFNLARLNNGEGFMRTRIERRIRHIIIEFLLSEPKGQRITLRQKLLVTDAIIRDLSIYNNSFLTGVKFDIRNALRNSRDTLQSFAEFFSTNLALTVKSAYEDSTRNTLYKQDLAKYCSLLLTIPNWDSERLKEAKKQILPLCKGVALKSEWGEESAIFEFSFSEDQFSAPFDKKKVCHFRRYLRAEHFHQSYYERLDSLSQQIFENMEDLNRQ